MIWAARPRTSCVGRKGIEREDKKGSERKLLVGCSLRHATTRPPPDTPQSFRMGSREAAIRSAPKKRFEVQRRRQSQARLETPNTQHSALVRNGVCDTRNKAHFSPRTRECRHSRRVGRGYRTLRNEQYVLHTRRHKDRRTKPYPRPPPRAPVLRTCIL